MITDADVIARWDVGESMTTIGDSLGISRERVRQRLLRNGRAGPNRNALPSSAQILAAASNAINFKELAENLAIPLQHARLAVIERGVRDEVQDVFASARRARREIKRRDAQRPIIQIIRRLASDLGHTPTQEELASAGVYHAVLQKVFGSAASAMVLSGLVPNVPGRPPMDLPSEFAKDIEPTADEELLIARVERIRRSGVGLEPPTGDDRPEKREISGTAFIRHPRVVAWVLEHANGICESCGQLGYETDDGDRFLEVHHVIPLADGGPDVVSNAVAVCETCHGKLHRWTGRRNMRAELYEKIDRLTIPDIQGSVKPTP